MKKNKLAGFWIRGLAKFIDVIILVTLILIISWFNIKEKEDRFVFKATINFYILITIILFLFPLYFILIPFITNGFTLGKYILKIKIKFNNNHLLELIKRETFFSLLIAFNLLLILIFVNHSLMNKFFQTNQKNVIYTSMETFRISIVRTFSSIGALIQILVGLSIIVKKGQGYSDTFSKSNVVYINKFIEIKKTNTKISRKYKPKLIEQKVVEWIK